MVASAAASWGTWSFFLRQAERDRPIAPELESAVALLFMTLVAAVTMTRDRVPVRASKRAWAGMLCLGVSDALNVVFFFRAIQTTTVAVAVLTHYLTPLLVALIAPVALGERVSKRTFGAVGVALAGLVLLLGPWRQASSVSETMLKGGAFGAASAVFYAANVILNKRLSPAFSGSELAFYHGLVAVPVVCGLVPIGAWDGVAGSAWGWLVAGSIGPGAVAGLLFVWGLRRIPAAHASALTLLEPFVAVLLGVVVFGEVPTALGAFGAMLVLAGAAAVVAPRRRASARSP
jgi:drug/metabolite transporter (DMT)-like permease